MTKTLLELVEERVAALTDAVENQERVVKELERLYYETAQLRPHNTMRALARLDKGRLNQAIVQGRYEEARQMWTLIKAHADDGYTKGVEVTPKPHREEVTPMAVRVVKPFKEARTPCPPAGTEGELIAVEGVYLIVRFPLPMTDTEGVVWESHFDNADFMTLKFRIGEIEVI